MNECCVELLMKRKKKTSDTMKEIGAVLGGILIIVISMLLIPPFGIFGFLLFFFAFYLHKKHDIEYEYIYVNGDMDVDQIMSKTRRSHVHAVNFRQAMVVAPIHSTHIKEYSGKIKEIVDVTTLYPDREVYAAIIEKEKGLEKVLFEPNEEILQGIRQIIPRKLFRE